MTSLGQRATERALANVGVKESGTNTSKWVNVYLKDVGLPPGNPWCAAFLYTQIRKAAADLGVPFHWPQTGLVQAVYNWAHAQGAVLTQPQPYAAFVIYYAHLRRYGHIGLIADVERRNDGLYIKSVEGNSNDDGSREGVAVVSKWRKWKPTTMRCIPVR